MTRRSVHTVVEIPIGATTKGLAIPILILQNGDVSLYVLAWAREMMIVEGRSPGHINKAVCAVGLLYDFYIIVYGCKTLAPNELRGMMKHFFEAREYGNTELGWKSVGNKTARNDVRYASEFSKFCSDNFGTLPINPFETRLINDLNFTQQLQFYAEIAHRPTWDLLYHLQPSTSAGNGITSQFSFNPLPKHNKQSTTKKYFPPDKVIPFLRATNNLRDLLAFLLMFFGAFRESELFHLFVTDITAPGYEPEIRIGHPEISNYNWSDPFRGSMRGNRTTFLSERYGLAPRNRMGLSHPLHAGWKGMLYTKDSFESDFFWLLPEIAPLFAKLHRRYIHQFRAGVEDSHPYYFVNLNKENYGTPLKMSNLTKSFYRTAIRAGLRPSDSGVNPHGARHFYGHFCATYLQLPMSQTQLMMRHALIQSTATYYSIDERLVRKQLAEAQKRMHDEIPEFISTLMSFAERHN
jgi:integrase